MVISLSLSMTSVSCSSDTWFWSRNTRRPSLYHVTYKIDRYWLEHEKLTNLRNYHYFIFHFGSPPEEVANPKIGGIGHHQPKCFQSDHSCAVSRYYQLWSAQIMTIQKHKKLKHLHNFPIVVNRCTCTMYSIVLLHLYV